MVAHRVSELRVTMRRRKRKERGRIPRCYVWEATKWINEKEKSDDGKRDQEKERKGEMLR